MTMKDRRAEDREALQRLLDVYGADRTRWPARERLRFASVVSEDKASARLLAEAEALDRLLDSAPRSSDATVEALKERILAAAQSTAPAGGSVVTLQRPASPRRAPARAPALAARLAGRFAQWPAAAVMAASLAFGVMLGSVGTFDSAMEEMVQVAGFSTSATDSAQLALGEDLLDGQSEEDWL